MAYASNAIQKCVSHVMVDERDVLLKKHLSRPKRKDVGSV